MSALMLAARTGHVAAIHALLADPGVDPNARSRALSTRPTDTLPVAVEVSGAGLELVCGTYARDGSYGGAPLFKKGQVWLLRYRMPASGHHFWYLADKDNLTTDDGD